MSSLFNRTDYTVSEHKIKSGLTYLKVEPQNGLIKLFPVQAFELACFLIDWIREQETFTDSDVCTVSKVGKSLTFGYIDQFTYKISEDGSIIGRVVWNNPSGKWVTSMDGVDISLENRYRNNLFEELQVEYDRICEDKEK